MTTFRYQVSRNIRRDVLRVTDEGLEQRGRSVGWNEVAAYRAYPRFAQDLVYAALGAPKPRLSIYLRSGQLIRVRGDILVRDDEPLRRDGGIPIAFGELVSTLQDRAVKEWRGPREEYVLMGTAWALFVVAGAITAAVSVHQQWALPPIGAAIVGGVIAAQVAFILSGVIARRLRRVYIAALDAASSRDSSGRDRDDSVPASAHPPARRDV